MTTKCIHESDEIKDLVEKNLGDENKLALHHHITIDVLEFIDIEELNKTQMALKDLENTVNEYVNKRRIINNDFLLNKLKPIFNENNTFVFEQGCETSNFDYDLYKINCLLSQTKEKLEKIEKEHN